MSAPIREWSEVPKKMMYVNTANILYFLFLVFFFLIVEMEICHNHIKSQLNVL